MTSPEDAAEALQPGYYRHWIEDRVRFADLDPLGHCNNAAILGFIESSRVAMVADIGHPTGANGRALAVVRTSVEFHRELGYGAKVRIGGRVLRLGRSSIAMANAVFFDERCAASAEVVAVLIGIESRRPVELPVTMRDGLSSYA